MARLFGFPDSFKLENKKINYYDLFGNSIAVNVVKEVSENLIRFGLKKEKYKNQLTVNSETIQKSLI